MKELKYNFTSCILTSLGNKVFPILIKIFSPFRFFPYVKTIFTHTQKAKGLQKMKPNLMCIYYSMGRESPIYSAVTSPSQPLKLIFPKPNMRIHEYLHALLACKGSVIKAPVFYNK